MIQFNQKIQSILEQPVIESFYLVTVVFKSQVLRTTNYFTNIVLSSGETFQNDGKLVMVDPPRLSTTVDREQYKITFADPDFYFGPYIDEGIVGAFVSVRLGFVDQVTELPLVNSEDTIVVYEGTADSAAYAISNTHLGESLFVLTCSSPMGDLDLTKYLQTSKDALRYVDPSDTSFDQIYEGAGQIELKWGKG